MGKWYIAAMKQTILLSSAILGLALAAVSAARADEANVLTEAERADGWKLLFNGEDLSEWRNYREEGISDKWQVADGAFTLTEKGGGDIVTKDEFGAFELKLDYRISPAGNSGIMYHVTEEEAKPWQTGPEIQIQDNAEGRDPQKAGWLYQLYAADTDATKPAGEWNTVHIVISPGKCVHYMNGTKYVEYDKGSADWDEKVAASKFSKFENFGKPTEGRLSLQDHGDVVSFRNVKIKPLD